MHVYKGWFLPISKSFATLKLHPLPTPIFFSVFWNISVISYVGDFGFISCITERMPQVKIIAKNFMDMVAALPAMKLDKLYENTFICEAVLRYFDILSLFSSCISFWFLKHCFYLSHQNALFLRVIAYTRTCCFFWEVGVYEYILIWQREDLA